MESITNELRTYVGLSDGAVQRSIHAIADRIDTEYEKAIRELNNLANASVLLPLDADGVPIHIGDVMENLREDLEPRLHHRFKVYGIHYRDCEQMCSLTEDGYPTILYRANECRHYHAPTVEDLLLEACKVYHGLMIESMSDVAHDMHAPSEIIAEYAAKLRAIIEGPEGPEWQETASQDEGR